RTGPQPRAGLARGRRGERRREPFEAGRRLADQLVQPGDGGLGGRAIRGQHTEPGSEPVVSDDGGLGEDAFGRRKARAWHRAHLMVAESAFPAITSTIVTDPPGPRKRPAARARPGVAGVRP